MGFKDYIKTNNTRSYANVYTAEGPAGKYKKTIKKDEQKVFNLSDQNALHDFASYNALFTLSGLSENDISSTKTLLNSKPHDIIIKSSGIGPTENQSTSQLGVNDKMIVEKNERLKGAINKSQEVLKRNRDLYFRSVTMNTLPGLNAKRRLTSVTEIQMEVVEPAGITLLERVRAAAINNNFLDHLDATYLLTVEFQGFDEFGRPADAQTKTYLTRKIPIKFTQMDMDVTAAGTVYSIRAIPQTEYAYLNRYNYLRTAGTLNPPEKSLKSAITTLQDLLNKQTEDEQKQGLCAIADKYIVSVHEDLKPEKPLTLSTVETIGMASQEGATGADAGFYVANEIAVPPDVMKLNSNASVIKILEELMKGHPDYREAKFKEFKTKAANTLGDKNAGGADPEDFYFDYFRIRSNVKLRKDQFDTIRATNAKEITFTVEPYKVHAYSLAIPGISTGENFKAFVYKTYNYIFTGENVDILDLNIQYRAAYFQGRLKDFQADNVRKNKIENVSTTSAQSTTAQDHFTDPPFITRSEVSVSKSEGTGLTGGTPTELDAFLDSLTHPLADMVNIRLEILGDPAWLGQSQFIPANPELFGDGVHRDSTIEYFRSGFDKVWNEKLRCYNSDLAEPIILLNFRMPTDLNNTTGVYELQSDQSANFSGLYRVIQVEHNFVDGKYTNVLHLTRFNNQGVTISNPVPKAFVTNKRGEPSEIKTFTEIQEIVKQANGVYTDVINIGRKFKDLLKGIFS